MRRIGRAGGFSMIEVLISILVLALGVIGAAGMQLSALRTTHQSSLQTTALQLAADMADRMRANDSQMRQPDKDNPFLAVNYRSATDDAPEEPSKLCYADACDSDELASFDIYEWEKRIKAELPSGRVRICRDASPWDETKKALSWSCSGDASASLVIKLGWQGKNPDGSLIKDADKDFPPAVALTVEPYIR